MGLMDMIKKMFGGEEKKEEQPMEGQAQASDQGMSEESGSSESHEMQGESAPESTEEERPQQ